MLKYSKQTGKVTLNRIAWAYIGAKNGWMPTILSIIKAKQTSLIKTAQSEEISDDLILETVRNSVDINYGQAFIMRDNDTVMDEGQAKMAIQNAFEQLVQLEPNFKEKVRDYVAANRSFALGVYMATEKTKKTLVPTFNGVGITELRSRFTALIPQEITLPPKKTSYNVGETDLKGIDNVVDMLEMVSAAGFVAQNAVVEIGSIGSRVTNWDTSYKLHINGMQVGKLQAILTWFTNIENKDIRNLMQSEKKSSFDLTMFNEVNNLMSRFGLGKLFVEKVREVKKFEEDSGLKRLYQRERRIKDRNKTKTEVIRLNDHVEDIFGNILGKLTSFPNYVAMLQEKNVGDPQDFLSFAFTMGQQGNILNAQEAQEVVDMGASVAA